MIDLNVVVKFSVKKICVYLTTPLRVFDNKV